MSISSNGNSLVFNGLSSGINTTAVINALMQVAAQPQQMLHAEQTVATTQITAYQALNTALQSVTSDALLLTLPTGWKGTAATSSDDTVATAASTSAAVGGAFTFSVGNLATSSSLISSASVASTSTTVTSGNLLLSQASGLGFSGLAGDQVLATGSHTLTVTTATTGANLTGTTAVAASTTITAGSNDSLAYTVDGVPKTVTIAPGTYGPTQLAAAVAAASNGDFTATINGNGDLQLTTTAQGSAHSASVTGGTALAALGLTGGTSGTGTDGAVNLDGGPSVTVSDAHAGAQLSLTSGTGGTVTATLAGGLTAGATTLSNVSTASGSLSDVIAAINGANAGMTATAVGVGNSYRLQLTSTTTGAASSLTLSPTAFLGSLGTLTTLQAGQDARLTVGSGPNAYQVTSPTNQVGNALPGVTINLLKAGTGPVTISVGADSSGMAAKVHNMISDINSVITQAKAATAFDPNNAVNTGPLLGDNTVEGLASGLTQAVTGAVAGSGLGDASAVGITVNTDGTLAFDQDRFSAAMAANPQGVADLFQRLGGNGIAQQVRTFADGMSNPTTGAITAAIQGSQATVASLADQITAMQPLLDMQRQQLTLEFTQMETALSQLNAQKTALGL
ncbi:MAG TPA: flagellar filament capping protein FliD [Acidimicrobiales bacterium]|nr:flagellar filament capping protein FliD [Acidimicrobiales bacterium]